MIICGDSLEVLKTLETNSIDAVVTDPPYGWRFMGKAWDAFDIAEMTKKRPHTRTNQKISIDGSMRKPRETPAECAGTYDISKTGNWQFMLWTQDWAKEMLRVLKPGGFMVVFCGPRTYHAMAMGVEQAGFEIRDQLQWIFGSGFPKSLNLGNGWGTALKPANEPIVLARKPLSESTVAKNVLRWGCGALNIDGTRIAASDQAALAKNWDRETCTDMRGGNYGNGEASGVKLTTSAPQGRWPANVLFDEEAAAMLDEQSGQFKGSIGRANRKSAGNYEATSFKVGVVTETEVKDFGGASRFFYVAKASKRERNAGLEGMPERESSKVGQTVWTNECQLCGKSRPQTEKQCGSCGGDLAKTDRIKPSSANHHPTVKPIKLMEYLCTLITPPGGTILDPFCGSGSTGVAAINFGFKFIGIEREKEYVEIANKRLEHASKKEEQLEL